VFYIYRLMSPSGKSYIGQTKRTPEERFRQHVNVWQRWIKNGRPRKSYQTKLWYAFDVYPPDQWTLETLDQVDQADVNHVEQRWIDHFDSQRCGYNLQAGGQGWHGSNFSEEHRKKQSIARKAYYETEDGKNHLKMMSETMKQFRGENHPHYGREAWNRGITQTDTHRTNIGKALKQWWDSPAGLAEKEKKREPARQLGYANRGKVMDDAWRENMQPVWDAQKGRPQTEKQKAAASKAKAKVWLVTSPDGSVTEVTSLRKWCLERGLDSSNVCRGGHRGYRAVLK
jgi:hypothetical protein